MKSARPRAMMSEDTVALEFAGAAVLACLGENQRDDDAIEMSKGTVHSK